MTSCAWRWRRTPTWAIWPRNGHRSGQSSRRCGGRLSFTPERTRVGLVAACARGRAGGRKPKLDEQQVREIKALLCDPSIQVTRAQPYTNMLDSHAKE
ncbi:MAG: hypothetical protein EKK71_00110 [Candidatus Competibacteraceae bacterium]|nr:MAG: hypothetical protein EKK71_00110 [Candidatus Competibacteraceae bacterium]